MAHSRAPIPDDSSTDEEVPQYLKTTQEEIEGTIPPSTIADAICRATATAQGNPTVERGLPTAPRRKKHTKAKNPLRSTAVQTEGTLQSTHLSPIQKPTEKPQSSVRQDNDAKPKDN